MIGISKVLSKFVWSARLLTPKSKLPEGARVRDDMNGVRLVALSVDESLGECESFSQHAVVVRAKVKGLGKDASLSRAVVVGDEAKAHPGLSFAAVAYNGGVNVFE